MRKENQIEEMFNIIVDGVIDGENNHGVPTGKTCLNIAQALYEEGYRKQREGEWISVEERLPDKSGQYLTWHGVYYGLHEYSVEKQGWNITYCEDRSTEIKTVTHWMPLPDPQEGV